MNITQLVEEWIEMQITFRIDLLNGSHLIIDGRNSKVDGELLLADSDGYGGTTAIPLTSIMYATFSVVDPLGEQVHHG
jgi:hypothetical protein